MHKSWMWKQRSYRNQFQDDESGRAGAGGAGATAAEETNEQTTEAEQQAGETPSAQQDDAATEDDEEVVITLGDEIPPATDDDASAPASPLVKKLREEIRERNKRLRELETEKAERERQQQPGAVKVGDKPTLEGCEFDTERFETELTAWHERKRAADDQAAKQRKEQEDAQAAWQGRLTAYNTAKAGLKVADFEDAEAVVLDTLNQTQQGIIVSGADSPEKLVYALGKNPAKLKELAAIKDPVKYAFAVAKLETQLKVTPRKSPPPAEKPVRGSAAATGMDSTLARLEAEAEKTGDRSKVIAYKRQQRQVA